MVSTRDSSPVRIAGYLVSLWGLSFALVCSVLGGLVTSVQWRYLMSVPGGKWSWSIAFGLCSAIALFGLVRRRYNLVVFGTAGIGGFCGLIAMYYLFAPAFIENMITLGWLPWILCAVVGIGVAVMNRTSREW